MKLSFRNVNLDFNIGIITLHLQFFFRFRIFGHIAAFIGKFSVAAAFGILYLYTAELLPNTSPEHRSGDVLTERQAWGIMAPLVLLTVSWNGWCVCVCACIVRSTCLISCTNKLAACTVLGHEIIICL